MKFPIELKNNADEVFTFETPQSGRYLYKPFGYSFVTGTFSIIPGSAGNIEMDVHRGFGVEILIDGESQKRKVRGWSKFVESCVDHFMSIQEGKAWEYAKESDIVKEIPEPSLKDQIDLLTKKLGY